jgi:hypothetical protein
MPKSKSHRIPHTEQEGIKLMLKQGKSNARLFMNTTLIGVSFTIFALLFSLQSDFLIKSGILTMQLVLSVPFLLTSTLADTKLSYTFHEKHWESIAWSYFIIGYCFLLNVVGILVYHLIGFTPAALFFVVNIALMLTYSAVEISYNREATARRISKDLFFIIIIFLGGIWPILA